MRDIYKEINGFEKGYRYSNDLVKDKNGDLLADYHNIQNRCKNYSCHTLNPHEVNDVIQAEIRETEPLVLETGSFEIEIATERLEQV